MCGKAREAPLVIKSAGSSSDCTEDTRLGLGEEPLTDHLMNGRHRNKYNSVSTFAVAISELEWNVFDLASLVGCCQVKQANTRGISSTTYLHD